MPARPLRSRLAGPRTARRPGPRLPVERLEPRDVPSALSVSDVIVREGPTATGILDPAGAARLDINGVRVVAFDIHPDDAHSGDLFVTGYLSHSVVRFDWATQTYPPLEYHGLAGPPTSRPSPLVRAGGESPAGTGRRPGHRSHPEGDT